jgi:hypothetical protein
LSDDSVDVILAWDIQQQTAVIKLSPAERHDNLLVMTYGYHSLDISYIKDFAPEMEGKHLAIIILAPMMMVATSSYIFQVSEAIVKVWSKQKPDSVLTV